MLEILIPVFSDSEFLPSWFFDKSLLTEEANDEILIPVSLVVSLLLVSLLSSSLILFCSVTSDPPTLDSEAIDEIFRPKSVEALSSSISLLFSVVTEEICRSWLLS